MNTIGYSDWKSFDGNGDNDDEILGYPWWCYDDDDDDDDHFISYHSTPYFTEPVVVKM